MKGVQLVLGGTAAVYCIHDRQKRQVTTEAHVAALGAATGQSYNPTLHKLHRCSCCDNLFVDYTDIPRFCSTCLRSAVHTPAGPLPEPEGVI